MSELQTKPKRGRPRDRAADEAILEAAEQALASRGYEAMTMEQVATLAQVSKPTLYLRFRSKAELVGAMIDGLRPPLPPASGRSIRADLLTLVEIGDRWVDRHGLRLVAALLLEQDEHPELLERFIQRVVEPVRTAFEDVLRGGIERGEVRKDAEIDEVVDALTGAYWARAWTGGTTKRGWAARLVDGISGGLVVPQR